MAAPSLHAYILAGGTGQRFWPLSRELKPKQLLTLFGTESLIVQAVGRVREHVGEDGVTIVCGEQLSGELRDHLLGCGDIVGPARFLIEPSARNTGPAIALAAADLELRDAGGVMIVLPSDHVLSSGDVWSDTIAAAANLAAAGRLVTIGITPTRPETGYGYIEAGEPIEGFEHGVARPAEAVRFVEKPDEQTARTYVASGAYLWNAGIFVMKAATALAELTATGEEGAHIVDVARRLAALPKGEWRDSPEAAEFAELPRVPIDTALMEKSQLVAVIPADLGWSDVGSLLALDDLSGADQSGNRCVGRGIEVDCEDTTVYAKERCVAALGLSGLLVVDTEDATLVCPKDRAQDVRLVVEALKARGDSEVVEPRTAIRPWGSWTTLLEGEGFKIKRIDVSPGRRLSLQRHEHRNEHWVVIAGTARVTRDGATVDIATNESTYIPARMPHRLENAGDVPLAIIEVQVGSYVGEDDIERLEDDWERGS